MGLNPAGVTMKPIVLVLALMLPLAATAQYTPASQPPDSSVLSNVVLSLDTTLLDAAYFLQRTSFDNASAFGGIVIGSALVGVGTYFEDIRTFCYIGAGAAFIFALVKEIDSFISLRRAGRSLERFHYTANGLAIDL